MTALSLKHLDISYGETQITHGITLDIAEGESFALVGESGSGKSTVLKAVAGLAPQWTGSITAFGQPRTHGIDQHFARHCQMVFQDPYGSLHPRKTIDAILSEPLAIHGIGNQNGRVEDMLVAAEILNLLKRLRREQNLTFLMVTHNLPVVSFLCDRLAVMRHGRIVEIAAVADLKRGALQETYSRELMDISVAHAG
eukprot:gene8313-10210_t